MYGRTHKEKQIPTYLVFNKNAILTIFQSILTFAYDLTNFHSAFDISMSYLTKNKVFEGINHCF